MVLEKRDCLLQGKLTLGHSQRQGEEVVLADGQALWNPSQTSAACRAVRLFPSVKA